MADNKKLWRAADDKWNSAGGMRATTNEAYPRSKDGYTISRNPTSYAVGLAGRAVDPSSVVRSIGASNQDKMRSDGYREEFNRKHSHGSRTSARKSSRGKTGRKRGRG